MSEPDVNVVQKTPKPIFLFLNMDKESDAKMIVGNKQNARMTMFTFFKLVA